jgi:hypothetical protein
MRVEQKHNLGRAEAVRRINAGIEGLLGQELPAGVVVTGVSRAWSEDTLRFSFTAKKGFFGVPISGVVRVTEELVALEADLPGILTAFIPEEKIRGDLQTKLAQMLSSGGPG